MSNTTSFYLNSTYFIGMDLHSNNVVVCVLQIGINRLGQLSKKLLRSATVALSPELKELEAFLQPYCSQEHQATVESTYNWYNIADLFERRGWHLKLADPTTVKNNKIKFSNDLTDAEFLADQMRLGALRAAKIIPKKDRAFRDLVRMRVDFVQDRARYRTILKNFFNNQRYIRISTAKLDRLADQAADGDISELAHYFDDHNTVLKACHYLLAMRSMGVHIAEIERQIQAQQQVLSLPSHRYLKRLQSMKGCGFILSSIIASEIVDINRFPTEKDFVSYCRLSPASRLSNGKDKGEGNRKNGNAYLSWAMTELANLMVFHNPHIKKKYDRLMKKSRIRAKAIRSLAAKLARCIWHMLKEDKDFEIEQAFR